ncbi:MAG: class I tRNA ligase family protein, partial [Nanoarchaeota archaeon]|nr:class I tRNA ligase family protein [Nanoarchaeota archaeon]
MFSWHSSSALSPKTISSAFTVAFMSFSTELRSFFVFSSHLIVNVLIGLFSERFFSDLYFLTAEITLTALSPASSAFSSASSFWYFGQSETEKFFWQQFCDNYLEIVKDRLYNKENYSKEAVDSAHYTLYNITLAILKLMAPIMPHITEEIYHLYFAEIEGLKSIHGSDWPKY